MPVRVAMTSSLDNCSSASPIDCAAHALAATRYGAGSGVGIKRVKKTGGKVA